MTESGVRQEFDASVGGAPKRGALGVCAPTLDIRGAGVAATAAAAEVRIDCSEQPS